MLTLLSPDRVVPAKHPLRGVKALADAALAELSPTFVRPKILVLLPGPGAFSSGDLGPC